MVKNQVAWSIIQGSNSFLRTNRVGDGVTLTRDPFSLNNRHGLANSGLVDSRGIAVQKHGRTGGLFWYTSLIVLNQKPMFFYRINSTRVRKSGLSVTFVKDRVFTNKAKKGKNIKHYNFRTTKIGGTVAAKKFAGNKRILARVSRIHQSASHFRKSDAAKKAAN